MSIAWVARGHRETLFPLRKKTQFQKAIRRFDAGNSSQPQFGDKIGAFWGIHSSCTIVGSSGRRQPK
jgi:hypothetical protein